MLFKFVIQNLDYEIFIIIKIIMMILLHDIDIQENTRNFCAIISPVLAADSPIYIIDSTKLFFSSEIYFHI